MKQKSKLHKRNRDTHRGGLHEERKRDIKEDKGDSGRRKSEAEGD